APTDALAITAPSSWTVLMMPAATPPSDGCRSRVASEYTGPQMKPMPKPLTTNPGTNAHRLESACAARAMNAEPAASRVRPTAIRYFWCTILASGPLARPDEKNIAPGWMATINPAATADNPSTDW